MPKMKIKKGDLVEVITGRAQKNGGDRGKQGKVLNVDVERQRVLVEGVRMVKRHTKAATSGRGARTEMRARARPPASSDPDSACTRPAMARSPSGP